MKHKLPCLLALAFALAVCDGRLCAAPAGETVKKNADEVFSRPEFSRLHKLRRSDLVREDLSQRSFGGDAGADGQGNGNDGPDGGQGNGQGDGQGNNQDNGQGRRQGNRQGNGPRNQPGDNNNPNRDRIPRDAGNPPQQRGGNSSFGPSATFGNFGAGLAGLFKALGILAIAVMIVVIVILIVKAIQDRESRLEGELTGTFANDVGELEVDHPPSEYPSEEYLRRAAQLARAGDFRQAVAFVLLGAMSEVESRGFIRYRKGLTQRDYYRTVRRHQTIGNAYRNLLKIYEPLGFGRRSAELKHYQTAVKLFRGGFGDRVAVSEV